MLARIRMNTDSPAVLQGTIRLDVLPREGDHLNLTLPNGKTIAAPVWRIVHHLRAATTQASDVWDAAVHEVELVLGETDAPCMVSVTWLNPEERPGWIDVEALMCCQAIPRIGELVELAQMLQSPSTTSYRTWDETPLDVVPAKVVQILHLTECITQDPTELHGTTAAPYICLVLARIEEHCYAPYRHILTPLQAVCV